MKSLYPYLLPVLEFLSSVPCLMIVHFLKLLVITMGFSWHLNIAISELGCAFFTVVGLEASA